MIRTIDLKLNVAHPDLPLPEAVAFAGSPSAVFLRGIPRRRGSWTIDAVRVVATFPDGTAATRSAVESPGGVWTATIPGTATSGRTVQGFRVVADGTDENGEPVTNYVLGFADLAIVSLGVAPSPAPGETAAQVWYFDSEPDPPRKGDVYRDESGTFKFYDGEAWVGLQIELSPAQLNNIAAIPNKANRTELCSAWAANTAYTTTSVVIHDNALYRCIIAHTSGEEWDSTKWTSTTLAEVMAQYLPLAGGDIVGNLSIIGLVEIINAGGAPLKLSSRDSNRDFYDIEFGIFDDKWQFKFTRIGIDDPTVFYLALPFATGEIATTAAVNGKAPLESPAFTGTPTAPTPDAADNSTNVATTAFVKTAISGMTPNLDYVMRVDPETGGIYYTTPDTNA